MLVHPDIAPLNSPVSGPGDLWRVDERPGGTAILGDGVEGGDCSTLVSDMGHVGHVLMAGRSTNHGLPEAICWEK